ncbi:MAG: hypothetical protein WAV26_04950 [Candidatus Deferrimicrobium sp.]
MIVAFFTAAASFGQDLFATHAHLVQNRFHLFFRYPVIFHKDLAETPVRPAHDVILHLLRERALDLFKGYILSINGDAPEAIGPYARG